MMQKKRKTSQAQRSMRRTKIAMLTILLLGLAVLLYLTWQYLDETENAAQNTETPSLGISVCIDAGHGGKDNGAQLGERLEKDDTLALALAVQEACEKRGLTVVMTRTDDTYLSLQERCNVANESGADLFVSIHRNSSEDTSAGGVEIWTANAGKGAEMAQAIMDNLSAVGISENRGVQQGTSDSGEHADYYVNKHTTMPACLIELGFISNETDNALLDAHLSAYAEAIADGILQAAEALQAASTETAAE